MSNSESNQVSAADNTVNQTINLNRAYKDTINDARCYHRNVKLLWSRQDSQCTQIIHGTDLKYLAYGIVHTTIPPLQPDIPIGGSDLARWQSFPAAFAIRT
jgi:hypothetical protein